MKRLFAVFIGILILVSCCTIDISSKPDYSKAESQAKVIYEEYIKLSSYKHIVFHKKVSVKFDRIDREGVVGFCAMGPTRREVVIDINYWNNIGKLQKLELLFHELTHCFCGRMHDYGDGKPYPEVSSKVYAAKRPAKRSADFDDGCPKSIMFPRVLDKKCIGRHYGEYTEEMFDRCNPF